MLKTCMKNHSDVWFLELNKFYLISLRWGHNALREFTLFGLIFWQLVSIISYDSYFDADWIFTLFRERKSGLSAKNVFLSRENAWDTIYTFFSVE